MKKSSLIVIALLIIAAIAIAAYFLIPLACPTYINMMPGIGKPNTPWWQQQFCKNSERVY